MLFESVCEWVNVNCTVKCFEWSLRLEKCYIIAVHLLFNKGTQGKKHTAYQRQIKNNGFHIYPNSLYTAFDEDEGNTNINVLRRSALPKSVFFSGC